MPEPLYALQACREHRGLGLEDLAVRAGVSVATLRKLESGSTPTFYTAHRLADALAIPPCVLWHELPFLEHDPLRCQICALREVDVNQRLSEAEAEELMAHCLVRHPPSPLDEPGTELAWLEQTVVAMRAGRL